MSGSAPASPGLGPAAPGRSRGARPRYVTPTRPHARAGGPPEERCIGGPSQSAGGPPRGRGVWPRATYGLGGRGGRGLREPQLRGWELPSPDGGEGRRAPSSPESPSQRLRLRGPLTGPTGFRWASQPRSSLGVADLSREGRGPCVLEGKADKVGNR